ncbi:phosphate ABC transporter, permease protein PstA [Psychromonas sp. psych-6C06]|uniref:phosphate ABC transporter permease PstA n=1 Tax=Psychromonas sp. psych-6C06 TaxID=2058089 RepID=UPI000C339276|nr:phosphate ABC transporter permease PstA [Psychromonas sp. psych-6C06]PKF61062.1 phosphate ABC transporter, permease protein PstA [Psychromonas sp. psych-6C06]
MNKWFKSGTPWIWMTGGAVSLSLIMVIGLFVLIGWRGLSFFWPATVYEFDMLDAQGNHMNVIGEIYDSETVLKQQLKEAGIAGLENRGDTLERYLIKVGNREYVDLDFQWVLETVIVEKHIPSDIVVLERTKNGNFYGYIKEIQENGVVLPITGEALEAELEARLAVTKALKDKENDLLKGDIGRINFDLERIRLKKRKLDLEGQLTAEALVELDGQAQALRDEYLVLEKELFAYRTEAQRDAVVITDMTGRNVVMPMAKVLDFYLPNKMTFIEKIQHWFHQTAKFVSDDPREANTEGGVFPAIFGTVFMVMLMAVIVTPFGVVAAIYLHEYAPKNTITKFIRIAVINLAGVPSIVYGVFGLGFFVYIVGGSIDQLLYPEALPSPTFGSPGVLWSALTLAILTLPVVIVSTEEGLSRIPSSLREGSLALGATKSETLWRIIVPMASPAIMTGLILAVARAAGEVAPLMLVGVVKMAPTLPVDGNFPYLHLERKFMHLGFHIYDVGFQSPNVEAARPLVYATSFLLVTVIIGLNLAAIGIRNSLREKYRALEH